MRPRIYINNSVIGGYYDDEFLVDTRQFFDRVRQKDFWVNISEITRIELLLAPEKVRNVINLIPPDCLIELEFSDEAKHLGEHYIGERILSEASLNDAYHIAIATVNRLDVVVSWNFRHIVNLDKIRMFNAANLRLGYPQIDIRTPKELIRYEG